MFILFHSEGWGDGIAFEPVRSHLQCVCMHMHVHLPDDLGILLIFALAVSPLAEHDRGVHIGWGECVGLIQK